ncbi:helix-turn-helix domain-containing protein [Alicyclobacillus shizuokensis]|uniref:helix-turn-helix domain-containing protein n=1 Tax=Alicyclobacillus shizuokensis TaxID=392014 RepID=UPI0012EDFF5B
MAQQYDRDFKLNVVQMVLEQGKPAAQVARELGISPKTVYGWEVRGRSGASLCGQWSPTARGPDHPRPRA